MSPSLGITPSPLVRAPSRVGASRSLSPTSRGGVEDEEHLRVQPLPEEVVSDDDRLGGRDADEHRQEGQGRDHAGELAPARGVSEKRRRTRYIGLGQPQGGKRDHRREREQGVSGVRKEKPIRASADVADAVRAAEAEAAAGVLVDLDLPGCADRGAGARG